MRLSCVVCKPSLVISHSAALQVEFNKAALSLSDAIPEVQKKAALTRLLKVGTHALTWSPTCVSHQTVRHTQTGQTGALPAGAWRVLA